MNIIPINEEDNVGDGLAKINYNFVKLNQDTCELLETKKDNFSSLKQIENLMLWLDDVISYTDYDKLQKLETTIQMLSSYWNKYEFTVQYPFNPSNGFTSSLVSAGEFGGLSSFNLSTTNQADQENLIGETLVKQGLYETVNLSIKGLKDFELLYVFRDTNGVFVKWDFLDPSFIFNLSVDLANNLYYDGTLIDIYKIPYYSAITTNKDFDLFKEEVFATFSTKRISIKGTIQPVDKMSLNNLLIVYDDYQRIEEEVLKDDEGEIIASVDVNVTTFTPEILNLNSIIPQKNTLYKNKISLINDSVLESAESNPRLNRLCLNFLDKDYPAKKYFDGTVVNVVFFLYNLIGYDTNATSLLRTDYYDQLDVSTPKNKLELFNKKDLSLIAPSSNTTFTVYFSKKDSYIEKIVNVKYVKNTDIVTKVDNITGKITTSENHYWEFKNATLGAPFNTKLISINSDLEQAPTFFTNLTEFGKAPAPASAPVSVSSSTNTNEYDYNRPLTKKEREREKNRKKKEKEQQKEKEKKEKEKEQREKKKQKEKEKKEKEKERIQDKKQKEKEKKDNKKEKEDQKKQKNKEKDNNNNNNRKNNENNRKQEKSKVDEQVKKKDKEKQNDKEKQDKKDNVKNNKQTENNKKENTQNKNKQENDKKEEKNKTKNETKKEQKLEEKQQKVNEDKQAKQIKAKKEKEDEDNRQKEKQRKNDEEKKKSEEQKKKDQQKKDDDDKKKKQQDEDNKKKQKAEENKGTKQGNNVETKQQKKQEQAKAEHRAAAASPNPPKPSCFVSGTTVTLFNGEFIDIKNINAGYEILTYNFNTKQNEMSIVSGIETSQETSFIKIVLDSGKILLSTIMHPYYVYDIGLCTYNPTEYAKLFPNEQLTNKLKVKDILIDSNKQKHTIINIEKINCEETTVYNLNIKGNENYYANDILVGN